LDRKQYGEGPHSTRYQHRFDYQDEFLTNPFSDVHSKLNNENNPNKSDSMKEISTMKDFSKLSNLHWDNQSGGVRAPSPQYFIHGYVRCNEYEGDLAHSCAHGEGPHSIKVCITKTDNDPDVFSKLKSIVGQKPQYISYKKYRKRLKHYTTRPDSDATSSGK
jgi:hypothetical protein